MSLAALIELRNRLGLDIASYRVKQTDHGWEASLTCGRDGCCPCWTARGGTQQEAIDRAASHALHYWHETAGTGYR